MSKELDWNQFEEVAPQSQGFDWNQFEASTKPQGIQWGQIGSDVLGTLGGIAISPFRAVAAVPELIGQAYDFGSQPFNADSVKRLGQNVGTGLLNAGVGLRDLDKNINEYLKSRGLPSYEDSNEAPIGRELRQIASSESGQLISDKLRELLTPEGERSSDQLVQALASFAPLAGLNPSVAIGVHELGQNRNPFELAFLPQIGKAATTAIPKAIGKTTDIAKSLHRPNIAKSVVEGEKAAKRASSKAYNSIFDEAEAQGLGKNLVAPDIDVNLIKKASPGGKYTGYILKTQEEPTLKNLHKARSDVKKFIRANEFKSGDNVFRDALNEAYRAENVLSNQIYETLGEGKGRLVERLLKTDKDYRNTVVPYGRNKALQEFKKGEIGSSDLVRRLARNEKFKHALGKQHPEVKMSHALHAYGRLDPLAETFSAVYDKLIKEMKGS